MTTPPNIWDVLGRLSAKTRVPVNAFFVRGKRDCKVWPYRCALNAVLLQHGYRVRDLAEFFGVHHTTIIFHRTQAETRKEVRSLMPVVESCL